jgi:hypothetical protein
LVVVDDVVISGVDWFCDDIITEMRGFEGTTSAFFLATIPNGIFPTFATFFTLFFASSDNFL